MTNLLELTLAQRIKKKQVFRKNKAKIKLGRKRASRKRANTDKIKQRARRQAIKNVKKIIARGKNLNKASASEKTRIERLVKKRKNIVNRATRKLIPQKRKQDRERLSNSVELSGSQLFETLNILNDSIIKEIN
jgi:hypothetical protein